MPTHRELLLLAPLVLIPQPRRSLRLVAQEGDAVVVAVAEPVRLPLPPAVAKAAHPRDALAVVAEPVRLPQYPRVAVAASHASGIAAFQCPIARR